MNTSVPRDPGMQVERTALAWSRTALALLGNGLLALRSGWVLQEMLVTALAVALLVAAGLIFMVGIWRRERLLQGHTGAASSRVLLGTAGVVWLACLAGLASMLNTCA